jgi:creatinine deaminase
MDEFMQQAFAQAKQGHDEGNLPVGSVVVSDGVIIGRGRNRQHQTNDPTTHAELEAIRDASSRTDGNDIVSIFKGATCYTTMMPCPMCAGAIIRFGFSRVVVAETQSYADGGTKPLIERQGIVVDVQDHDQCVELVEAYLLERPDLSAKMKAPKATDLKL